MAVIEQEPVISANEQRARVLERAADAILGRGWCQNQLLDDDGHICGLGALYLAYYGEVSHDRQYAVSPIRTLWGETERSNSGMISALVAFNDQLGQHWSRVYAILRWRAEEIRDGL